MYIYTALWIVFFVTSLIKLNFLWCVIVFVAITLNAANVVGYTKVRFISVDTRHTKGADIGDF